MSEAVDAKYAPLDVITIGRASVDLYGQQIGSRLEDITSFAKSVGGCPANISVGTARLGLRSALLTRVGDEQMAASSANSCGAKASMSMVSRPTRSG